MKKVILSILFVFTTVFTFAQKNVGIGTEEPKEKLDVQGAIKIGTTQSQNAGTIRWTGSEFQAYNGKNWLSLGSQFITSNQVPSEGKLLFWSNSGEGFFTVSHSENLFWNTRTNAFEVKGDLKANTLGNQAGNFTVNALGEIKAHSLQLGGNLIAENITAKTP